MVFEEHRLERRHERQVEPVEPDHRLATVVVVVMPVPFGGQDEVTGRHLAGIAVDGCVHPGSHHHEADRRRRVPMRGRGLSGTEILDSTPQRGTREREAVQARVGEGEHAPVAAALERDDLAGPLRQRIRPSPWPQPRLRGRERHVGHQGRLEAPERLQVARSEGAAKLVVTDFDGIGAADVDGGHVLLLGACRIRGSILLMRRPRIGC